MSDDPTTPPAPKLGRARASTRTETDRVDDDDVRPARGRIAPTPEPNPDLADDPTGHQLAGKIGPKVLVWNTTKGNRVATKNVPATNEDGTRKVDGQGLTIYEERVHLLIPPGLSLLASDLWLKLEPELKAEIECGEIRGFGDDPEQIPVRTLKNAIADTGVMDALRWIAERDRRAAVQEAVEIAVVDIAPKKAS